MARYCFYCGNELSNGEKCNCRSSEKPHAEQKTTAGAAAGAASRTTDTQGRAKAKQQPKKPASPPPPPKAKPNKAKPTFDSANLINGARQIKVYLTAPADTIRAAAQKVNRQAILIILLFQGVFCGLFLLVSVQQPLLTSLLSLSAASFSGSNGINSGVFIFLQGLGISIVCSLLLTTLYFLALRFLYRRQVAFLDILSAFSPSFLYFTLFTLIGMFGFAATFFSSLLMVAIGFAVAVVAQYLAVCELSGFDDNRSLMMVAMVSLVYAALLSLLLSLSLPFLTALLQQTPVF